MQRQLEPTKSAEQTAQNPTQQHWREIQVPWRIVAALALVVAIGLPNNRSARAEEGFRPLFDGESLEGWVQRGGKATYEVENGEIVGTSALQTPNSFLCTEKEYGDFILEFEFKVDPLLNSGVQIRSKVYDEEHSYDIDGKEFKARAGVVHGYQVEIDPSDRAWSAGIYDESRRGWLFPLKDNPRAGQAFRQSEWNHYRILCWGSTIKTWINGVPASHLVDGVTTKGLIALQVHGIGNDENKLGTQVRWRNLQIKEFDSNQLDVYIGTYTNGSSEGIYRSRLDLNQGNLSAPELVAKAKNPSFVALSPTYDRLYAVSEVGDLNGKPAGGVIAYSIEDDGQLKRLNEQPSGGGAPCHLIVDPSGQNVLVANYSGGNAACLPIDPSTGELKPISSLVQHEGSSVNKNRQAGPHAHSINVDFNNRFAFVADLGIDKVMIYQFDPNSGQLEANDPASVSLPEGGGPRHFAWHPSRQFAFVNNEMTSTVTSLSYVPSQGMLQPISTVTTLPEDYTESGNSTAEVAAHPNGRFVYVSNRGHDSIASFQVDSKTGQLTPMGHTSTKGKVPRNFTIDPSGRFLLAENQQSNNVVVFQIDAETGSLSPVDQSEIEVGAPVCIRFAPVPINE